MARYDKYDPKVGGFRAALAADYLLANVEKVLAVGLDSSGRVVVGAGQTGVVGVLVLTKARKAGEVVDVMTAGEIVDFGRTVGTPGTDHGTPGTVYYAGTDGKVGGGADEVQVVTVTSSASPFTLTFDGQTTGSLSGSTTTGAQLQTALEALSNIAVGDVSVSGDAGGPYTVTFGGAYDDSNVAAITGTNATATTSTGGGTTEGFVRVGHTVEGQRLIVRVDH